MENMYNKRDEPHVEEDADESGGYGLLTGTSETNVDRHYNNLRMHKDKDYVSYQHELHSSRLEPDSFTNSQVIEPISSNMGISYNPSYKFLDKSQTDVIDGNGQRGKSTYYTYTRLDPQLIRDDESGNRLMENPKRDWWTQKHSAFEAGAGTVSPDDVYDPTSNGHGDHTRSYYDPNFGQVKYYYGDVSTLRGSSGNFIGRSKIDHMEFQDPMSKVLPDFQRRRIEPMTRELVQNKWVADTTAHRESIMESLMKKRNRESWQQRYAPLDRSQSSRPGGYLA